jgi:site-specific DNA-methyltransferase (adenine-specific)
MNTLTLGSWQDSIGDVPDESVDLIIIDPPYMTTGEKWDKQEAVNDELSRQLFRIAKPSCSLYVWCGIGEKSQSLIRWFPIFSEHWHFKDLITWKKQRGIGMRKGWLYTREELMWFVKDNKQFVWNKEHQYSEIPRKESGFNKKAIATTGRDLLRHSNVWIDITEKTLGNSGVCYSKQRGKDFHFTPKPERAIERIIQLHTQEGDVVFDCFAGSGTTGVVAKKMNRRYIMIEKEAEYMDLIVERLANV